MSNCEFSFEGLEELQKDCEKVYEKYPSEAVAAVKKTANKFTKDVNRKLKSGSDSKNITKRWKKEEIRGIGGAGTVEIDVRNNAPHFHLVENGHELEFAPELYSALQNGRLKLGSENRKSSKKGGRKKLVHMGWVKGKHYCQDTRTEYQNGEYLKQLKPEIEKIMEEHDL